LSRRRATQPRTPPPERDHAGKTRAKTSVADMSLPTEQRGRRGRRKGKRVGGTPPAQLDHGNGSRARKLRDTGWGKLDRARQARRRRG
jgi:hypothetical protein